MGSIFTISGPSMTCCPMPGIVNECMTTDVAATAITGAGTQIKGAIESLPPAEQTYRRHLPRTNLHPPATRTTMPVLRSAVARPYRKKRLTSRSSQLALVTASSAIAFLTGCATAAHPPADASNNNEPIGTVQQIYDGTLTPDLAVHTFRHIDKLFPTRRIARGDTVTPLPESPQQLTQDKFDSNGKHYD